MCAQRVLRALIEAGARPARPGEFTLRAFLNGRLDLSQVCRQTGERNGSSWHHREDRGTASCV